VNRFASRTQTTHKRPSACIALFAVLAALPASAQDRAQIEAGAEIYRDKCAQCHGERLVNPGSSFDLRKLGADERARYNKSVAEGKGQMPAWGGVLSDEEMDQLWAYIRSKAYN
jgi:mono/diheme cytochrome c family protein